MDEKQAKRRLGIYIATLRSKRGWKPAHLAKRADTSQTTIDAIESGKRDPGATMLAQIVVALGADWADIGHALNSSSDAAARVLAYQRYELTPNVPDAAPPPYNPLAGLADDEIIALADEWNDGDRKRFRDEVLALARSAARLISGQRGGLGAG